MKESPPRSSELQEKAKELAESGLALLDSLEAMEKDDIAAEAVRAEIMKKLGQ